MTYQELVAKHGTLREFEAAVWRAVGEISVAEAEDAIYSYAVELDEARKTDEAIAQYGQVCPDEAICPRIKG